MSPPRQPGGGMHRWRPNAAVAGELFLSSRRIDNVNQSSSALPCDCQPTRSVDPLRSHRRLRRPCLAPTHVLCARGECDGSADGCLASNDAELHGRRHLLGPHILRFRPLSALLCAAEQQQQRRLWLRRLNERSVSSPSLNSSRTAPPCHPSGRAGHGRATGGAPCSPSAECPLDSAAPRRPLSPQATDP